METVWAAQGIWLSFFHPPKCRRKILCQSYLISCQKFARFPGHVHIWWHPLSYCDLCHTRGLLDDSPKLEMCLEEAIHLRTLWTLCLSVLLYSFPVQPASLWDKYRIHPCDDLRHALAQRYLKWFSWSHLQLWIVSVGIQTFDWWQLNIDRHWTTFTPKWLANNVGQLFSSWTSRSTS